MNTDSKQQLAEALASLAPTVRHGLQGSNCPPGMTKDVCLGTTDRAVEAAQIEFVRRALSWVGNAHPDAVLSAFAAAGWVSPEEHRAETLRLDQCVAEVDARRQELWRNLERVTVLCQKAQAEALAQAERIARVEALIADRDVSYDRVVTTSALRAALADPR